MPRGRIRASEGIAEPHCVQNAAGGVERWQVGQRISPGLGVAMCAHCALLASRMPTATTDTLVAMKRINVVGTSCSGKTTLARAVAGRLAVPHIELDALFWSTEWTPVPDDVFRARVARAVEPERWVVDGGYSVVRDVTWGLVDTVVWLDYPLRTVLGRWARRTVTRIQTREEFWAGTGNRESLRHALRPDGLLWWIVRTHRPRRTRLAAQLALRPDIAVVRLDSPSASEAWLRSLS